MAAKDTDSKSDRWRILQLAEIVVFSKIFNLHSILKKERGKNTICSLYLLDSSSYLSISQCAWLTNQSSSVESLNRQLSICLHLQE